MSPANVITDEELLSLPKDGHKHEVVDGELIATLVDWQHESIIPTIVAVVGNFVEEHHLGEIIGSNLLYVFPNGNKRAPDLSFITAERLAALDRDTVFPQMAPDLAIEVLCRFDTARLVLDRIGDYLDAGVRLVWVVDPMRRQAAVYRSLTEIRCVDSEGELDGEDVLPGFRCRLAQLLK